MKSFAAVVLCLLVVGTLQRRHLKRDPVEAEEVKTVLESNHFYSETETTTTEKISNLQKNEALLFILKDKDGSATSSLAQNPITIHLSSNQEKVSCTFNSIHNLCTLKSVSQEEVDLKIECKKTPCEVSWKIVQPKAVETDGMHNIDELVQINKQVNHAIVIASCPDPSVKDLGQRLHLYTNSKYETVVNEASILYLFDNEEKGYYLMTTEDDAARACVNITIKHNPDQVQFNQKDGVMMDYVLPGKTTIYEIPKIPDTDFRIDAYYHQAKHISLNDKSSVEVSLIAEKGSERTKLQTISIPGKDSGSIDFSVVFKKPAEDFKALTIDVENKGEEIIIIDMDFKSDERQEVNLGESSYFHLKAGEKINYKLIGEAEQVSESKQTHIFSSDEAKFIPSLKMCKAKTGCEFSLEAKEEGQGYLYFGEADKKDEAERIVIDFDKSATHKMREGESIQLKKHIEARKAFQAVVSSPNVLIYAATKEKCPQISRECHEKVLNSHNPFIYQPVTSGDLYFLVEALDNCEFTLTTIDEGTQYVEVKDTKPFTYLFDDAEREMKFEFKLQKKENVNFNLIGPVNELNLVVLNAQRWNEDNKGEGEVSTDGFIGFKKEDIESLSFVIKVEKREEFLKKFIHFTLLVSTQQGNVRLQPGISHFQNIKAEETRDYVFQFQPKKQILLNVYTHNIRNALDVELKVSTTDEYDKDDGVVSYSIEAESQVIELKKVAEELCKDEMAENCELFVRLHNKMGLELDITLTLMMKDAIIEIKDGIWNSFQQNEVARTSHFYFLPKHPNKSVTILYRADFIDLKLMYTIWKTDDKSISPNEWPFPNQIKSRPDDAVSPLLQARPTKLIHIDSHALKECWQNCVILITVFEDRNGPTSKFSNFMGKRSFRIMGSNNFIEIPEKQKIDVILKKDEEKHLLVDLKYVMNKNALTFFTYFTMGEVFMSGNVYDEQNPRCPTADEVGDFRFGRVETQISLETVKKKLQQYEMSEEKHPYICILARALNDTKFSIEYDSNDEILTQIHPDTTVVHQGKAKSTKIYQIDAVQEFRLKITRNSGFPFIDHTLCKSTEDLESCLNAFKEKEKGQQLANKTLVISQEPCDKCILFLKVTSEQPSEINIHSQSKYAETQLQEKRVFADEVEKEQVNKYIITANKNQELTINIQITHGDLSISVNDFAGVSITKTNQQGSNHIVITIPPKNQEINGTAAPAIPIWGRIFFSAFAHSVLHSYHVEVKPQKATTNAVYSISYYCGEAETYLQDGLITTQALIPNRTSKFLYENPSNNKIYLHISATTPEKLNNIRIKILSMANVQDEETGVEINPERAKFNKKTANPTVIMALPGNRLFQIQVTNENKEFEIVTLGINNQEVIYLPFNHQFPLQLNKGEYIYLIVNSPYQAYIDVSVKKCSESQLTMSYTTDYQEFLKEEFQNEQEMDHDQLTAVTHIKTKMHGAVYFKLKSSPDEVSVLTVRAVFSFAKNKVQAAAPGGKGLISYQLLDSRTAELEFEPLVCPASNRNCQKDFTYSAISAEKAEGVYAQLVCPSIAFDLEDRQILEQGKSKKISASNLKNSRIMFQQSFTGDIDYVGIKAENSKTGEVVYYKPVEIATFWGQVQKNSKGNGDTVGIILAALVVCCILIVYRRRKRAISEYTPLSSEY